MRLLPLRAIAPHTRAGGASRDLSRRARTSPLLTELRRGPAAKAFLAMALWAGAMRTTGDTQPWLANLGLLATPSLLVHAGWHGARERHSRTIWLRHTAVRSTTHRFLLAAAPATLWPVAAALPWLLATPGTGLEEFLVFGVSFGVVVGLGSFVAFALGRLLPLRIVVPALAVGGYFLAFYFVAGFILTSGSAPERSPDPPPAVSPKEPSP
ncbi:hypothetical protein ACFWZ2_05025 [Streptomyces sp. NPDC059002]|uniref:hypothetical protein n=1 Tax=Streptomyces sp. NPDC059002 TaxID=3346690 RepID=UPI00368499E3